MLSQQEQDQTTIYNVPHRTYPVSLIPKPILQNSEMKTSIIESTTLVGASTLAVVFTGSEMAAVAAFAVIGAVFGSPLGMLLRSVLTAPGLEKLTGRERLIVNWLLGTPVGFSMAWTLRDKFFERDFPVEVVGLIGAFTFSTLGAVALCFALPKLKQLIRGNKTNR